MSPTIAKNTELFKQFLKLLQAHRGIFKQERTFQTMALLAIAELLVFTRHTVTQMLMSVGRVEEDWSKWYRFFSHGRFSAEAASEVLFGETLKHVSQTDPYVLAIDGTQTRRSSRKMEGAHWLHNPQSPVFKRGIHIAQRWVNGSWLVPAEDGYSRAVPIRWLPAFTEKSNPKSVPPCKEWEAAVQIITWVKQQFRAHQRAEQPLLVVGDGSYDTLNLWKHLPSGCTLIARSAKNRVLYYFPKATDRKNKRYGDRAPSPREVWQARKGWTPLTLLVRSKQRRLQYKVSGPFLRKGAPNTPLFLIVVRGKNNKRRRRIPLPFLVNAIQDESGNWQLPFPPKTLLFWTWQRWEVEVAHRELKSNFGLGNKQCWHPKAAVLSVQWSAWLYAVMLLAGYRTWNLTNSPPVPTRWWRGAPRWSLNTLWRGYRSAFWQSHQFTLVVPEYPLTRGDLSWLTPTLLNSVFAAARS